MDPPTGSSLPPISEDETRRLYEGYERTLGRMSQAQLMAELTRVNAALASSTSPALLPDLATKVADEYRPLARSSRTASPTPPSSTEDRGREPSQPSPSALDLLAGRANLSRRVAGRLVLAQARAQARRR